MSADKQHIGFTKAGVNLIPIDCPVCAHRGLWDIGAARAPLTVLCLGCFRVFALRNTPYIQPNGDLTKMVLQEVGTAKNIAASQGTFTLELHPRPEDAVPPPRF